MSNDPIETTPDSAAAPAPHPASPTPSVERQPTGERQSTGSPEQAKSDTSSHKTAWERDTLERLAFATLAEQRANRRWRIFFRFAWLLLVVALIWTGTHRGGVGADPTQPHTAVVAI